MYRRLPQLEIPTSYTDAAMSVIDQCKPSHNYLSSRQFFMCTHRNTHTHVRTHARTHT